jgi:hypothetical protein
VRPHAYVVEKMGRKAITMSKKDTKGMLKTTEDDKDESSEEQPTDMQELTDEDLGKVQGGVEIETDRKAGGDPQNN